MVSPSKVLISLWKILLKEIYPVSLRKKGLYLKPVKGIKKPMRIQAQEDSSLTKTVFNKPKSRKKDTVHTITKSSRYFKENQN